MIHLDLEQGSAEWIAARIGIPTASQFHRLITPRTMKLSEASHGYLCELLAEQILKVSLDSEVTAFMDRGKDMESEAVAYYELQRGMDTQKVGFCLLDSGRAGCSPDRLVGEDGGLEIKCPSAPVHVAHILGMGDKFRCQVQGALWVTGRKWWDLLSYHPQMPPALVRFERDEEFISKLVIAVDGFLERLDEARNKLIALGYLEAEKQTA